MSLISRRIISRSSVSSLLYLSAPFRSISNTPSRLFSSAAASAKGNDGPSHSFFNPNLTIPHVHGSTADFQWNIQKKYTGPVKAVILDWAGTVCDCGVYSPAVVFIDIFKRFGVPISMEESRLPMGAHKKVHIRKITQIPSVRARWTEKYGRLPTEDDVEKMFEQFVPAQLAVLPKYTKMIRGAVDTVYELQKKRGLKIGSTTGFTTPMVNILKESAAKDGYIPDCYVAADEVPAARPYPFMVWLNAIKLGISPAVSIVKVDDTADGISEGITAGVWSVGLAATGNYMGMTEEELSILKKNDPEEYERRLMKSYETLAQAGAHYVINDITGLPAVIDKINARLARGETPYSPTA